MIIKNKNPNIVADAIKNNGIDITTVTITSKKFNINTFIAEEIYIECRAEDEEKITNIVNNLNDVKDEKQPSEQEKINAQLLQTNAQQQLVNASLLKQIAELQKGGN